MFQSIKYSLSTTTAEWLDNRGTDDDDKDETAGRTSKKAKKSKSKKSKRKCDEE